MFERLFTEKTAKYLYKDVPLASYSRFRIGGPADLFFEARSAEELRLAVALASSFPFPFFVMGGGSNVLFDDSGFRGLVIKNSAERVTEEDGRLIVSSGTRIGYLVGQAFKSGRSGLEFLAGIPGTLGGSIFGNAGAFGNCIADVLKKVRVLRPGDETFEVELNRSEIDFDYRHSRFKTRPEIITEAVLETVPGDRRESQVRISSYLESRKGKHPPWGTACAGSYFKNPLSAGDNRLYAGSLLEQAGARGTSVGGAAVYEGHCNFIINKGGATASDVLRLAEILKARVKERFGIELQEEVIHVRSDVREP